MNIDIQYVWAGIIAWSAAALLAMAFNQGAHGPEKRPK
jgi:hypothetical protein